MPPVEALATCYEFFDTFMVERQLEDQMRQRRHSTIAFLSRVVESLMAERVEEFKQQKGLCMSWFDLSHDGPMYWRG